MKKYLSVLFLTLTFHAFAQVSLPDLIKLRLENYNRILPYEKAYLQCDRPFYKPGDDIWMAVWITDGLTNKPSMISEIVTVELINPKGTIEETRRLIASKGRATCDLTLDSLAPGGLYKIRAYTNWMKNFGEDNCFEKEIQIQNITLPKLIMKLDFERKAYGANDTVHAKLVLGTLEDLPLSNFAFNFETSLNGSSYKTGKAQTDQTGTSMITFVLPASLNTNDGLLNVMISFRGTTESISRSIPIILNQVDLQFFPEGGDLVPGTSNNCAFKALNEFGKPADIEGTVFNSKHQIVSRFKSYHQGMGSFHFTPQKGDKYYALIDRPESILQLYPLPQIISEGYHLEIPNPMEFTHPNAKQTGNVMIFSPENTTVGLIAQVNGKIYYSSNQQVKKGDNIIAIPLAGFPGGIAQITLFSKENVESCERLVYVKKDQQLKIRINTDKTGYLPRSEVKLTVKATDNKDKPVATSLGIAVVDDKLISMARNKSDNILTYLLLSSELKGKIEEPEYYFNPKETKADTALDYLLLTQGWRRFTWKEIAETTNKAWFKKIQYYQEQKILCGTISVDHRQDLLKTRLIIKETGQSTKPNSEGYYEFRGLDLTIPLTLIAISSKNDTAEQMINDYTAIETQKNYYRTHTENFTHNIVRDKETGEPLIGANILIKGTTIGTVTDVNGRFDIQTQEDDILVISYFGYKTKEVIPNLRKKIMAIDLEREAIMLDDVIVVGYGVSKKHDLTGSVVSIRRNSIAIKADQDNSNRRKGDVPLKPVVKDVSKAEDNKTFNGTHINLETQHEQVQNVEDDQVFYSLEERPNFQGGNLPNKWIAEHVRYPQEACEMGIEGKVYVRFTIDGQGNVQNPYIVRGLDPSIDLEVLRVVRSMPKWAPAKQYGKPVNITFTLPIHFHLTEGGGYIEETPLTKKPQGKFTYYRSRQFYTPKYQKDDIVEVRNDFRKTIYWNPSFTTDSTGMGQAIFSTSDELSSFRTIAEGISSQGEIGRQESVFYTYKPISIDAKIPEYLMFKDTFSTPVMIRNKTKIAITGKLLLETPKSLQLIKPAPLQIMVPADTFQIVYLDFAVNCISDTGLIKIVFETDSCRDAIVSSIVTLPTGYPVKTTLHGNQMVNQFDIPLASFVPNSLKAQVIVYPSIISTLTSSIEAMLKEPSGCFEQVSANTYPNVLALQYLKQTGQTNKTVEAKALKLIDQGYKILQGYETPTLGFEWFRKAPAHEGLTAFGLMEFNDMKSVYPDVNREMIERTTGWLLGRKDNKGGFMVAKGKWEFSNNAYLLNNAYIVYALSETASTWQISKEFEQSYKDNIDRDDAYCLALLTNAAFNLKDTVKARTLLAKLTKYTIKHGIRGLNSRTSITNSGGQTLLVETSALVALALLKQKQPDSLFLAHCIQFILEGRSFSSFGSTQANVLALKALTKYALKYPTLFQGGEIFVEVNGQSQGMKYTKDQTTPLEFDHLEKYLDRSSNKVNVAFKNALVPANFNINIGYNQNIPQENANWITEIETRYETKSVKVGETVRLTVTITGKQNIPQGMAVAIICIPSGFSLQPWQLKELQEKNVFDYFETRNNQLFLYYRTLESTKLAAIKLDLKAEIPGIYQAQPSYSYLYYTPELKSWNEGTVLEIKK